MNAGSGQLLTTSAMARAIERPEDTVRRLERAGVITAMRDSSGRRLFTPDQIERARRHFADAA